MIIAIDGPAGAGKSTIAKRIAKRLDIVYLDTGAMYRAFTLYVLRKKIPLRDQEKIRNALKGFKLSISENKVMINGRDATDAIRNIDVTDNVSYISSLDFVRKKMVELQRNIGKNVDIVAEGRDIGTVVFPDTKYKFYLDASIEERAKRRINDVKSQTYSTDIGEVMNKIEQRDNYDSSREVSPLSKAHDAVFIDSTHMTIDEVCAFIIEKVKEF